MSSKKGTKPKKRSNSVRVIAQERHGRWLYLDGFPAGYGAMWVPEEARWAVVRHVAMEDLRRGDEETLGTAETIEQARRYARSASRW